MGVLDNADVHLGAGSVLLVLDLLIRGVGLLVARNEAGHVLVGGCFVRGLGLVAAGPELKQAAVPDGVFNVEEHRKYRRHCGDVRAVG